MELLVPGLILVALMVYASTRIKKTAARAFEAETIETEDFTIEKPEGFLSVIGGDPRFAFEAYTREFGGPGAAEVRQATATVEHAQFVGPSTTADDSVISERTEVIGGKRYTIIETIESEKGVDLVRATKSVESDGRLWRLVVVRLAETNPDVLRNIETMITSFTVK